jgi:DNA-binding GntR family transcriptional regulator
MLKTREYTITVETHNQYVVVITANSEDSAIEIAEQHVEQHQADLEDMTIIETEIVEVNDA